MMTYERQAITSTARRGPCPEGKLVVVIGAEMPVPETTEAPNTELRDFLIVLRRALMMVSGYIEKRYLS